MLFTPKKTKKTKQTNNKKQAMYRIDFYLLLSGQM